MTHCPLGSSHRPPGLVPFRMEEGNCAWHREGPQTFQGLQPPLMTSQLFGYSLGDSGDFTPASSFRGAETQGVSGVQFWHRPV